MKSFKVLAILLFSFLASPLFAQTKSLTVSVAGNCGMCKKRIENSLKVPGITSATWNVETKLLAVNYDEAKVSPIDIQKRVALAGHDTQGQPAPDSTYSNLPGCCQYERLKTTKDKSEHTHQH